MAKNSKNTNTDIIDIDLSVTRKKRFRIDGDNDRILELNTSDLTIIDRLENVYPKLDELCKAVGELDTESSNKSFREIDTQMRDLMDYLFDCNVSTICAPSGSMFDPLGGSFRFEHIIESLIKLYEENLTSELKRVQNRVKLHTSKYTGK